MELQDYKCKPIGRKLQQSTWVWLNCMHAENQSSAVGQSLIFFWVDTVLMIVAYSYLNSDCAANNSLVYG